MAKQTKKKKLEKEVSKKETEVLLKKTFSPRIKVHELRNIKRYFVTETTERFITKRLMELTISNDYISRHNFISFKTNEIIYGCPFCKKKMHQN